MIKSINFTQIFFRPKSNLEDEMENFSKRIRSRRLEIKLTQKQVAQRAGVPLSTYKEWEYGRKIQGESSYLKLSVALEMNLYTLLSGKAPLGSEELTHRLQSLIWHLDEFRKLLSSSLKDE